MQTSFEEIGLEHSPIEGEQLVQLLPLAWREVNPSAQQQPAFPFYELSQMAPFAEELRAPHLVDRFVGMLHHVELVIDDPAVWRVLLDAEPKWFPHIHTRCRDPHPLSGTQLVPEKLVQRVLLALAAKP